MAAPAEKTIRDLDGKWQMNKGLSGDTDSILALQGIGWMTRKAIGLATVTLHVKEYTDEQSQLHIDIDQRVTGGIKATPEFRTLTWTEAEHKDNVFGDLMGKSRIISSGMEELGDEIVDDEAREFLKHGWEEGEHVESYARNDAAGWLAIQIWGFQMIDGVRRYVRNVCVSKGSEKRLAKLVYDWVE